MDPVYSRRYRVHVYEVDPDGRLSLLGALRYLQDIALEHADLLGVALRHLRPLGLTWVMTRYHLQVLQRPPLHSTVEVRTWPATRTERATCRDFLVLDEEGRPLVRASTELVVVSLETGRAVPLPEAVHRLPLHPARAVDTHFPPIPQPTGEVIERQCRARRADVDINQHVNNAVYVGWALETPPEALLTRAVPVELEIAFRRAATFGEGIVSRASQQDGAWVHQLLRSSDGKELTRLRTRWVDQAPG
ncbi:MAG: acyl-ACP thioesterase [Deltaproteobacteria bacterium]|nr:acyl-ACP thioesterase [Deltaproteobacteria bacterium]